MYTVQYSPLIVYVYTDQAILNSCTQIYRNLYLRLDSF